MDEEAQAKVGRVVRAKLRRERGWRKEGELRQKEEEQEEARAKADRNAAREERREG